MTRRPSLPKLAVLSIAAVLAALAAAPFTARADERPYAFTYEPTVSAQGETELEVYETLSEPRSRSHFDRVWTHQLELGYGLTDWMQASGYGVFRTTTLKTFELQAVKAEARAKVLGGDSPVHVVLYVEVEKEVVDDKPWALEQKLILGKDYGPVSWALNLIAEQEFPKGGGKEIVFGWSGGVAGKLGSHVRVGAESFGERKKEVEGEVLWEAYAGPTAVVSLPSGPFNAAWLIAGVGFGLNDTSDRAQARVVLGCDF